MIVQNTVITKWNAKTKKHYVSLGYTYTKMGDFVEVNVFDLLPSSAERVIVKCDYCEKEYSVKWSDRRTYMSDDFPDGNLDACKGCGWKKLKSRFEFLYGVGNPMYVEEFKQRKEEAVFEKYGVSNVFQNEEIKNKIKETNLVTYGFEYSSQSPKIKKKIEKSFLDKFGFKNVFQNEEIKEKIRKTNIEKYGVSSYTQTEEYRIKSKITNNERYGADNWMQTDEGREYFSGENSPVWKGGVNDPRWDRLKKEYKDWRFSIFKIYNFSCDICGNSDYVEAHHLYNYKDYPDLRYEKGNGVCLCQSCHIDFHRKYGKKNNTPEQYFEYKKSVKI